MDTSAADPVTSCGTDRAYSTSEDDSDGEEKCWKRQASEEARAMVTSAGNDFAKSSALAGEPPLRGKRKVTIFRTKILNNVDWQLSTSTPLKKYAVYYYLVFL